MKFTFILPSPVSFTDRNEFEKTVQLIAELGYDAIELQLGDADEVQTGRLDALLEKTGLRLSSFQTGGSYAKSGFCYSTAEEKLRRGAVEKMLRFVDLAAHYQAIPVTGLMQGRLNDEPDEQKAYARICDCMRETSEKAKKLGVTVAIEPCNKMEVGFNNTVSRVRQTIREVDNEALRTMVDTYHANIEEKSVSGAIRECFPDMRHLHLSETNRGDFGTGHLDFPGVFETLLRLGYTGYCAIGVYFTSQNIAVKARDALEYAKAALRLAELRYEYSKDQPDFL